MKIDGSMCLGLILLFLFPSAQTPGTFLAQIMHREFIVPNPPPACQSQAFLTSSFYATNSFLLASLKTQQVAYPSNPLFYAPLPSL